MRRTPSPHVGGQQLPLFLPESDWRTPLIPDLSNIREVAIDTETCDLGLGSGFGPGWATGAGHLCGVSLAWVRGSCYLPMRHPDSECLERDQVGSFLTMLYAREDLKLVFMNGPYDLGWIWAEFGLLPPSESGRLDDVGAMAVMVDENRSSSGGYSLDGICRWQGLPGKDEVMLREAAAAHGFESDIVKKNIWRLPARFIGPYAEADAEQTLAVAALLRARMEVEDTTTAYRIEADLIACCFEMRRRGIRVDTEHVEKGIAALNSRRDFLLNGLMRDLHWRHPVTLENVRSPLWVKQVCESAGVSVPMTEPKKTKTGEMRGGGRPSTSANWMRGHEHWLPRTINQIYRISEAADKFLSGYILSYAHRGRIHPTINQFRGEGGGTRSHRFSYADPPLQQAPGKKMEELDDLGAEVVALFRGAFLPEEGELWCSPDYSQQEYRLIVHYAEVSCLSGARDAGDRYRSNPSTDFHHLVVEMTGLTRRRAKDCNFAKVFGAGIPKFAEMTGMSREEAGSIMRKYDEQLPFIREESQLCQRLAEQRGFIKLIDGARSHFDLWEPAREAYQEQRLRRAYSHKAMNRLIQGSAARQIKIAMLALWREGIVPLLQMHDELPVSCSGPGRGERVAEIMREAVRLTIPVIVDVEYGTSWASARKVEDTDKRVVYGATWDDAARLSREGRWW